MIKNYFKTALRNLLKNKTYSVINIVGLAAGLSSFIIILLYLNHELSYDKWSPELNKVFKVSERSEEDILPQTAAPLASFLAQNYPAAEAATSIQPYGDFEALLATNNKKIYQEGLVMVDSSFLKVFPYKLFEGDASTALDQPGAVILSAEVSHKLFGNVSPLGKVIKVYNAYDGVVTGVMQKPETPSHLDAQLLMRSPYEKQNNFWENYSYQTYIKVKKPVAESDIEDVINRLYYHERLKESKLSFEEYKKGSKKRELFIDAVPDIHNFPEYGNSNFKTVSILLILAVLLLLAGAINFSNLSIAKSIGRAKEVGVRKILGSDRKRLIFQFMSETALQCLISLGMALGIVNIALPYLNHSFNINLSFWQSNNAIQVIAQITGCLVAVILLSGLYPSLVLSRFNAAKVLKGNYSTGKKGMLFRNSLIIIQFMVSGFFIIATLVINSQMQYMQNKDKGFSDDQVVRIEVTQKTRDADFDAVKNKLLSLPGVAYVAKTTRVPGDNFMDTFTINFKHAAKEYRMASVKVSADYFKTLQVDLVSGRLFTDDFADQHTRTAIINEAAAKKLNIADPVGQTIFFPDCDSVPVQIAGVVKDFNVQGFDQRVQPVVYTIGNKACMFQSGGAMLVKLNSGQANQSIAAIERAWKNIEPDFPIRYSFIDENFQQLFLSYARLQKIISFFGVIAILISVMGLFALTAFYTRQRTKEIGVRKVLGATVANLATLVGKEFIYLVLLSILIITPVAWWAMQQWLDTFAYRISISWWMFVAAGLIAIVIAMITVSVQAIKAAVANPVKSLRTE